MEGKVFFKSKIFWVAVIQTLISVTTIIAEFADKADISALAIGGLVTGILTIILRLWFTNSEIVF